MGSPAIFKGARTGLLSSRGLLLKDGTTIDNDGLVNFIKNNAGVTGTTGWVEGSYAAASRPSGTFTASSGAGAFAISTTTTNPLGAGTTSFVLTKSSGASRQGRAVENAFALPLSYRGKVLQLNIDYIVDSGSFVAATLTTDSSLIWYCAFSTDNGATYTAAEPSAFKLFSNSTTVSDRLTASIQTPHNATNMKLIAYIAESANSAWAVKCIMSVNPSEYVYGTPFTNPQDYTPTFTGLGTVTINRAQWWQEGAYMCGDIKVTAGTATATAVQFTLPNSYTVDYTSSNFAGSGSSTSTAHPDVNLIWDEGSATNRISVVNTMSGTSGFTVLAGTSLGTGSVNSFQFKVKIRGWSSNTQISNNYEGRTASLTAKKTTNQTIATSSATNVTGFASPASVDNFGAFNTATGVYTFYKAGRYNIAGSVSWGGSATGFRVLALYKNSSTELNTKYLIPSNASEFNMDISHQDNFVAGDTLNLRVFQNSGGNLNITNSTTGTGTAQFCINSVPGLPTIAANETVACSVTSSSGQSIPSGVATNVIYNNIVDDTHGTYNTTTGLFTVPVTGRYAFTATARYASAAWTAGQDLEMSIVGGGQSFSSSYRVPATYTAPIQLSVTTQDLYLTAGQLVAFRLLQTTGSAKTLDVTADYSRLTIYRIGL